MQQNLEHQDWKPLVFQKKVESTGTSFHHQQGFKKKLNLLDDNPEPPKTLKEFGKKISQARNILKLTQIDLGKKINIQANIIQKYETGDVVPDDNILSKICKALNLKKPKI